jgi:hypothetical protein
VTVIVIVLSLTISANAELVDEPVLPVEPVELEAAAADAEEPEFDPLPEETVSPTESLASEAIVPLAGA